MGRYEIEFRFLCEDFRSKRRKYTANALRITFVPLNAARDSKEGKRSSLIFKIALRLEQGFQFFLLLLSKKRRREREKKKLSAYPIDQFLNFSPSKPIEWNDITKTLTPSFYTSLPIFLISKIKYLKKKLLKLIPLPKKKKKKINCTCTRNRSVLRSRTLLSVSKNSWNSFRTSNSIILSSTPSLYF